MRLLQSFLLHQKQQGILEFIIVVFVDVVMGKKVMIQQLVINGDINDFMFLKKKCSSKL